jgi:hypothetical protein
MYVTLGVLGALKHAREHVATDYIAKHASFTRDETENARIKEAIRVYFETWVEAPLDMAIQVIEGKVTSSEIEYYKRFA